MNLHEYLRTLPSTAAKEDFARRCGTTLGVLRQISNGHRRAGESLAINIDRESGGLVPCETTRPDVDWAYLRNSRKDAA